MNNDEMSDLIDGYKSDNYSIEREDEVTVLVRDEVKYPEEEKYTYVSIVDSISESDKYFEWVGTVTKPKDERNYQVGKLEKWLGDTRASYHVIGIGGIFLRLYIKNGLLNIREQPNLLIQRYSLNIMDMMRGKRFGCSTIYDKDFLRRDKSGGFWA